jgi:hypothetical protein
MSLEVVWVEKYVLANLRSCWYAFWSNYVASNYFYISSSFGIKTSVSSSQCATFHQRNETLSSSTTYCDKQRH